MAENWLAPLHPQAAVSDKPWYDDAYEIGRQFGAGAAVDLPRMVGQGARWIGEDGGALDDWGRGVTEAADERAPGWEPDMQGRGLFASTLIKGGRAIAPMAPTLAAAMIPVVGQFAAPAMAAATFGPSSAQDTYDKIRQQGGSIEDANAAGWRTGVIQGGGEALGGALLRPTMAFGRAALGAAGATTGSIAARMTDRAILKPLAKGMTLNLVGQSATEVAQDVSTEFVERAYGAEPEDAWEIAKDSAQGAAGLTFLLGPLAGAGHVRRARSNARFDEALNNPNTPDTIRNQARDIVADQARERGATDTDAWLDQQFADQDAYDARQGELQETNAQRRRARQDRQDFLDIREAMQATLGDIEADPTADSQSSDAVIASVQANQDAQLQLWQDDIDRARQEARDTKSPEQQRVEAIKQRAAQVAQQQAETAERAKTEFGITKRNAQTIYGELERAHNDGLVDDNQFADMVGSLAGEALGANMVRKEIAALRKNVETQAKMAEQNAQTQADEMAKLQANIQTRVDQETAKALEKTPGQQAVEELEAELGKKFTPIAKSRLFTRLGFDQDGSPTGAGMRTLEEVAEIEAARNGSPAVTRQAIEKMLKGYKLTDADVEALGRKLEGTDSLQDTGANQELAAEMQVRTTEEGSEEVATPVTAEVTTPTISDGLDLDDYTAAEAMGERGDDKAGSMSVRNDLGSSIANTGNEDATAHSKAVMAVATRLADSAKFSELSEDVRAAVGRLVGLRDRVEASKTLPAAMNGQLAKLGDRLSGALEEAGDKTNAEMVATPSQQAKLARTRATIDEAAEIEDKARQKAQVEANNRTRKQRIEAYMRNPEVVQVAESEWDDLSQGEIAWDDLSKENQGEWIEALAANALEHNGTLNKQQLARDIGAIQDAHKANTKREETVGVGEERAARTAGEVAEKDSGTKQADAVQEDPGAVEDLVIGKPNAAVAVKTRKKRTAVVPEAAQLSVAEQDRVDSGKPPVGSTVAQVRAELDKLMPVSSRKLTVVKNLRDLPASVQAAVAQSLGEGTGNVQGMVLNGHGYLVADNIAPGKARSVFMHEVGVHMGIEGLLTKAQMKTIVDQIREWQTRDDSSIEFQLAQRAQDRLDATNTSEEHADAELLAYFVEEAVDAGIDPTAMSYKGELNRWFRTLWAAFKSAIRKLNLARVDQLNAQDVIDLAYGAARLEMTGLFHGTAAQFRKFNHNFMNSGEGAQAFGWGSYGAQRAGIAKGYWAQDVQRKTRPREFKTDQASQDRLFEWAREELGMDQNFSVENVAYGAKSFGVKIPDWAYTSPGVDGALMRVDTVVPESEMLDWDKKLSGFTLKALQEKLPQELIDELKEFTSFDLGEMTGKQFYRYLEDLEDIDQVVSGQFDTEDYNSRLVDAAPDKIVSTYLDEVIGIGGIRFLDANSRGKSGTIIFKGQRFTGEDFRTRTAAVQKLGDKAALLRVVLQKGPQDAISDLEAVVKRYEGMFYQVAQESAERFGTEFNEKQAREDAAKEAATLDSGVNLQWLKDNADSITIDTKDVTRNIVIFNDKNIQRVSSAIGADRQAAKFSRASPVAALPLQARQALTPAGEKALTGTVQVLRDIKDRAVLWGAFTKDLVDAVKSKLPTAEKYLQYIGEAQVAKGRAERNIGAVLDMYAALPASERGTGQGSANAFLHDSTMAKAWAYQPDYLGKQNIDPDLEMRFNALSPEGQAMVKAVFKHGHESLEALKAAVQDNIHTEHDELIRALEAGGQKLAADAQRKAKQKALRDFHSLFAISGTWPYAPLKRFGNHVVVGKSEAYMDLEQQVKDGTGSAAALEKLKADENHYYVAFRETKAAARSHKAEIEGRYAESANFERFSEQYGARDTLGAFRRLRNLVDDSKDATLSANANQAMDRLMTDLHLTLLGEQSARQSERTRTGVAGADKDMIRAFASQGRVTAHFIAGLENNGKVQDALRAMKSEAENTRGNEREKAHDAYNELMRRHTMGLDYQPAPVIEKMLSVGSVYMLLTSPAYFMVNATQPFAMSLPVLAGRHGYTRSFAAMTKAYAEVMPLLKDGMLTQDDYSSMPNDVQAIIEELANRGRIDISLERELGAWRSTAEGPSRHFGTAMSKLRGVAQNVEAVNRLVTAVAAARLHGTQDAQGATAYADQVVYSTHGDYSGFNAPRLMRNKIGRLATQFRKFQLIQLSLFAKLTSDSFKGAPSEERTIARKALAFSVGHMFAIGGVLGLPGAQAIGWLLGAAFGDDDEPNDSEAWLRKNLPPELAMLLTNGVPAAAGVNVSGRIGAGGMLSLLPYADTSVSRKGYEAAVMGALGPVLGSVVPKMADGLDLIGRGDYWKGLEQLMPKGFADLSKSMRGASEGLTMRNGDVVMSPDEVDFLATVTQAIGLPSTTITDRNWRASQAYKSDQFYADKTKRIKTEYVRAYRSGDQTKLGEMRDAWTKLQQVRSDNGFKRQPLSTLIKAPQEQRKREANTVGGVQYKKANEGAVRALAER